MELEILVNDFVSGREKNKLTDWWHERIDREVNNIRRLKCE